MDRNKGRRRFRLAWVNAVLLAVLTSAVAAYHSELFWAWREVNGYRTGFIGNPLERELYLQARHLLYKEQRPEAAAVLLEESIAIDPNTEALYILAESHRAMDRLTLATAEYERFLGVDYAHIDARLALFDTYIRLGETEKARSTARAGAAVFADLARQYAPQKDPSVDWRYNFKARAVHKRYLEAADRFRNLARSMSAGTQTLRDD